jgi:hypothetical protein
MSPPYYQFVFWPQLKVALAAAMLSVDKGIEMREAVTVG